MRRKILFAFVTMSLTTNVPAAEAPITELQQMTSRYAPVEIRVDTSKLSARDGAALKNLIRAARVLNTIFMRQLWTGDLGLYDRLRQDTSGLGKARLEYFWLNKGPWSDLDDHRAFLAGVPERKPPGTAFYPEDMKKEEFEAWVKTLSPEARAQAEGFFTVIRRGPGSKLHALPYSEAYRSDLEVCASLLREAAASTENATLKHFLETRAAAFHSNDYYASDVAWMDLDAPLDVTIGPYETYNDELFGYKAAFEAYVNIRDEAETQKLNFFGNHMQEVENNLPIEPKFRNPKIGALSPITVVNEVFAAGDADHGVKTAAYNLPNDERVVHEKGSKRVMLKNIQEAKFRTILQPIADAVLTSDARKSLNFESFFTHILAHEMSHGIGPHRISVNGRATSPRQELKELYSAIEEASSLYTTFLASSFRTLRFGLQEAHGKGMALQFNYLVDKGAFVERDGRWEVNAQRIHEGVRDLAHDLLTIEATGNYAAAKKMLDTLGVMRPQVKATLNRVGGVPVDIRTIFATADQVAPAMSR
jgi:hypothetical protein